MRKGTLKCFLYRDFFLARKEMLVYGTIMFFVMLLGLLVSLSTKYGNLAYLPEQYKGELEVLLPILSCCLPAGFCGFLGECVSATISFDINTQWRRFQLSTPVSGYIFALSKYIVLFGTVAIGIVLSFLYMWCDSAVRGDTLKFQSIAVFLVITFITLMISLLGQILLQLLGTRERAACAVSVVFVVLLSIVWLYAIKNEKMPVDPDAQFFFDVAVKYLPQVSAIFAVFLLVSFFVTAALLERREK